LVGDARSQFFYYTLFSTKWYQTTTLQAITFLFFFQGTSYNIVAKWNLIKPLFFVICDW